MVNRFIMKRLDVLKKWLPWLTDTPLVFSMNPPNDTFSLKNFSQSSPRMPANAGLENKAISTTPAVEKKLLRHFFPMRSSIECLPIYIFAFGSWYFFRNCYLPLRWVSCDRKIVYI